MPTKKPAAKKPGAPKDKKPAAPVKKAAAPAKKAAAAPAKKAAAGKRTATATATHAAVPAPVPNPDQGEMFLPAHAVDELAGEHVITSAPRAAEPAHAHDDDDDDDDDDLEPAVPAAPPPELTDEERELSAIYGEESGPAKVAHTEFTDGKTADEDRPLMPEINARAERKNRWEERRDQRRQRRDQRRGGEGRSDGRPPQQSGGGGGGGGGGGPRPPHPQSQHAQQRLALPAALAPPALPRPAAAVETAPTNGAPVNGAVVAGAANLFEHDALARVGTPLGDAAATVFAQLRNNQPLPVKQLAAMMRKRNLVGVEAEQLWPQLKAELLGDERSYRTLGLRPRIVYRGRDLFAPGPVATSLTAEAEAGMAAALSRLAGATHRALAQRVSRATAAGFERLIHAYLVAAGYRDIDWVKRVDGISYASVTAPGIERTVLISARSGDRPIDRRGIGELRVGVEAKNLVAGILFSAAGLSEEAEGELERHGRSISVVCGDQLIATLIAAGVGVVSRTAPLHYVDDQLLDELMQG